MPSLAETIGAGHYPAEYNPKVHGPYNPGRFYGKPDTPLNEVKLGEVTQWLSRRSYHPVSMLHACGRAYWRWNHKWIGVRKPGAAGLAQFLFLTSAFWWYAGHDVAKYHRHCKYHW